MKKKEVALKMKKNCFRKRIQSSHFSGLLPMVAQMLVDEFEEGQ
jgi:hypothetical protein